MLHLYTKKHINNVNLHWLLIFFLFVENPKFIFAGGKTGWIGDQSFVYLSTKKIKKLGWKNKFSIEDSIIKTVNWLSNNKWIFKIRK